MGEAAIKAAVALACFAPAAFLIQRAWRCFASRRIIVGALYLLPVSTLLTLAAYFAILASRAARLG